MAQIIIFSDVNGAPGFSRYAGPYRIATELRNNGYDVQVIDFFASYDIETLQKIIDVHVDSSTLFVGFAATLWTKAIKDEELLESFALGKKSVRSIIVDGMVKVFPYTDEIMKEIFSFIKKKNNNCKIVVGGYKAGNYDLTGVDVWILGQGETSVIALADHLSKGQSLNSVNTEWGLLITDKMYPYNKFNTSKITWQKNDFLFPNENVPIETARGCIFKCSFCAFNLNGKKFGEYTKEKDSLRDELIYNYENFGITEYMISDDTLNDSMQKVNYLYNVISSLPFKIQFTAYARIELMASHSEMPYILKEMGLRSVEFGIETLNKETGKHIGKQGDKNKIISTLYELKNVWKEDVYMAAGFIVGLPYESESSIRDTMNWLFEKNNPLTGIQLNRYWFHIPPTLPKNLGDKYNLKDIGFVETPKGWVYENISKIYANPSAYGYTDLNSSNWKNTQIDTNIAKSLEEEFYNDNRARQKKSMSIFQYYNRMRNIGYLHSEIGNLFYDDKDFIIESIKRKNKLKTMYLGKIL
jgi:radical SAM superfamily enzyme YgiQ (UPF0313 family)